MRVMHHRAVGLGYIAISVVAVLLGTLLCLDLAGLASGIGNNIGRVGGLLTPIFAALAAVDLKRLDRSDEE